MSSQENSDEDVDNLTSPIPMFEERAPFKRGSTLINIELYQQHSIQDATNTGTGAIVNPQ